ncbi:MAG TPA: hypothetical protein VHJ38_15005 [Nitrososphaeraceae archaeon]|jgi:hypothetical protein|nr:hypothetical protein [Nitrososphaeraceae archaeon]
MKAKNALSGSTLGILHYIKQRKVVIIIGAVLLILGFIGAVTIGTIVINDTVNNNLTQKGYPKTEFLGISAFSYEYASVFTAILGTFILSGGLFGMDSKKKSPADLT